jgi:hypothetical protein
MRILVVTSLSVLIELVRASSLIQDLDTRTQSQASSSPIPESSIFDCPLSLEIPLSAIYNDSNSDVEEIDDKFFNWHSATYNDEDSIYRSSSVSESFLEEVGLRSSRSSTPAAAAAIYSPPPCSLKRLSSAPSSLSGGLFRQQSFKLEDETVDAADLDYKVDFIDLEAIDEAESQKEQEVAAKDSHEIANITENDLESLPLPDALVIYAMDYCDEESLRSARLVSKQFKDRCDEYLKILANLTLGSKASSSTTFADRFYLSSTMLPLYRNLPQIHDIIAQHSIETSPIDINGSFLSLLDIAKLSSRRIEIFSDEFISTVLLPVLSTFDSAKNPNDPHPLFILSEAVIKCKRFHLFETSLVPSLNEISSAAWNGIHAPPTSSNYISPGFIALQPEQRVLGATLHAFIDLNLNLTVCYLLKQYPGLISLKNHFGRPALIRICESLRHLHVQLPGPDPDMEVDAWIAKMHQTFLDGFLIQTEFPGNSRMSMEMFHNIVSQSAVQFGSSPELVEYLGLNEEFKLAVANDAGFFSEHTTCIINQLICARQYDLLVFFGFHLGHLITFSPQNSPLIMAAEMHNPVIVAILLKYYRNVDVNQISQSGFTALSYAISDKEPALSSIRVLLNDPRVDPNLHHEKVPPLPRAIELGYTKTVALLLAHPAIDVNAEVVLHRRTLSPLICCLKRYRWDSLKLLLKRPNSRFNDMETLGKIEQKLKALKIEPELLQLVKRAIMPTIHE